MIELWTRCGFSVLVGVTFLLPLRAEQQFQRMDIPTALRRGDRIDGRSVELKGTLVLGFETSVLRESGECGGGQNCTIWLRFGDCVVSRGKYAKESCARALDELVKVPSAINRNEKATIPVTVRGTLHTVRRDMKYDKSVPRSARVGFGHLGAYPAEIVVSEMAIDGR